jgi:hypothetical protein
MTIKVGLSPREIELIVDTITDINPIDLQLSTDIISIIKSIVLECETELDKYEPSSYEFQRLMCIINKYGTRTEVPEQRRHQ